MDINVTVRACGSRVDVGFDAQVTAFSMPFFRWQNPAESSLQCKETSSKTSSCFSDQPSPPGVVAQSTSGGKISLNGAWDQTTQLRISKSRHFWLTYRKTEVDNTPILNFTFSFSTALNKERFFLETTVKQALIEY